MEIKFRRDELEYIPDDGMDYILENKDIYVSHYPELGNMVGKHILFYVVKDKYGNHFYVADIKGQKGNVSPKITKKYSGKSRKQEYCTSVVIQFNRMYHIVAGMYILV